MQKHKILQTLDAADEACRAYSKRLRVSGHLDMADLHLQVIDALRGNDGRLRRRLPYKHVLVDEFQDANAQQLQLLQLLTQGGCGQVGVTVIGDDDQSIYGFRCFVGTADP